jgi:hypothetical protein
MIDGDDCGGISGVIEWQGKGQISEEAYPSTALPTSDPTSLDPGKNLRPHGRNQATDRLNYGTAVDIYIHNIEKDEM